MKLFLYLFLLAFSANSLLARDWLDLNKIQNKSDTNLSVHISNGSGIDHIYSLKPNATQMADKYVLDSYSTNKYVMITNRLETKKNFSTTWHSGLGPYYTITTKGGLASSGIGVYIFQSIAYVKLIIQPTEHGYIYKWAPSP